MPPFREGKRFIEPKFDGDLLKFLRDVGHGHRVNIVDASYDIPDGFRVLKFPGSSAEALGGILSLIPIEDNSVTYMQPDEAAERNEVNCAAEEDLTEAASQQYFSTLDDTESVEISMNGIYRYSTETEPGFYDVANTGAEYRTYIRTIDDLPFACASLVVGQSQRTE